MNAPTRRPRRGGFTLIELLVVMVVLGILIALLVPAIGGAIKNAKNAAVIAEINMLAQALADFKSKYGDYPPSRILLNENGFYDTSATTYNYSSAGSSPNSADMTDGLLAQRSMSFLRKFFPRVQVSSSGALYSAASGFPDFNGNGAIDGPRLLTGDEALVFFLGGIPFSTTAGGSISWGVTGFSRNPTNPFQSLTVSPGNRVNPMFEFKTGRLMDVEGDGFPSYYDSLSTDRPYAYFSAYGGTGYDPNDVNYDTTNTKLVESDDSATTTPITLQFKVSFPVNSTTTPVLATSPSPNPYTTTNTTGITASGNSPVIFQNPQTFQIISAGTDGLYGVGGRYNSGSDDPLPVDQNYSSPKSSPTLRLREKDNLTNFNINKLD